LESIKNRWIENKMKTYMTKDMWSTWVQVIQNLQKDVGLNGEGLNVIY
jgi:hypothetical protein